MNQNRIAPNEQSWVIFVDMNAFFASCEQQANYWLRNRPIGVCVYTGRYGAVIATSYEAKQKGVKMGMRLDEAMRVCPDLVPVETHPGRYREFHIKIMQVLRQYSEDVIPKSIDEAIVNLNPYKRKYKDPLEIARRIKYDIKMQVGDWMRCSIGIAPNAFLAKLATEVRKPDGLLLIGRDNIDEILATLKLEDLPGISTGMGRRLRNFGIKTPLELRHAKVEDVRAACKSVLGLYWHYRLNFSEVDLVHEMGYKNMAAMRSLSGKQRESTENIERILLTLCMRLEQRMVKQHVFSKELSIIIKYPDNKRWGDLIRTNNPVQDGTDIFRLVLGRMDKFCATYQCPPLINTSITAIGVTVSHFVSADLLQSDLFEKRIARDLLRREVYKIKARYGDDRILKAIELENGGAIKDAIGFGSVKDLYGNVV